MKIILIKSSALNFIRRNFLTNNTKPDRKKFKSNQSYENLNEQERLKVLQALEVESEVKIEH